MAKQAQTEAPAKDAQTTEEARHLAEEADFVLEEARALDQAAAAQVVKEQKGG